MEYGLKCLPPWRGAGGRWVGTSETQDLSLMSLWGGFPSEAAGVATFGIPPLRLPSELSQNDGLLGWGTSSLPQGTHPSSCPYPQVPILPERVHAKLLLRVVGLGPLGAGDRLDGAEWHQPGAGLEWTGGHLAEGACPPTTWATSGVPQALHQHSVWHTENKGSSPLETGFHC